MIMQANHQNVCTDWCFGECLLLLEAFIDRRIELLLTSGIGNARAQPSAAGGAATRIFGSTFRKKGVKVRGI